MATSTSTSENSKKSFFKDYLVYNLSRNSKLICVSCILSAITLLCLAFASANILSLDFINNERNNIKYLTMLSGSAIEGLLILSFAAGIVAFKSCTRKNFTDTLLSLPLTHCQRFWGDFLTGFFSSAAPVIPFGVIAVIIAAIMPYAGIAEYTARYSAAVFFAACFMYCISVLAAVVSGKTGKSIVIGIMLLVDIVLLVPLWGVFFSYYTVGILDVYDNFIQCIKLYPSPFILLDFFELSSRYNVASSTPIQNHIYSIGSPLTVLLYAAEIAAVIAVCYFLSKHRKAENTGNSFANKKAFAAVNVLTALTAAGLGAVIAHIYTDNLAVIVIVCVIVFAVAVIIGEIVIQQWANFKKRIVIYGAGTAVCAVTIIATDATYGFGSSFYIPAEDDIEKIICTTSDDISFSFASEESISQICTAHKELLSENIEMLDKYSPRYVKFENFQITYQLKNGKEFSRYYSPNASMIDDEEFAEYYQTARLLKLLPTAAENYAEKYANEATVLNPDYVDIALDGIKGTITLNTEEYKDFAKIYAEDIKSHFNAEELPIGTIEYFSHNVDDADYAFDINTQTFEILESYSDTIAYLHSFTEQLNENAELFEYQIRIDDQKYTSLDINVLIMPDNLELAPVKELLTLIKSCNPYDYKSSYSADSVNGVYVYTNYFNRYYIPENDIPKTIELITQIAQLQVEKELQSGR